MDVFTSTGVVKLDEEQHPLVEPPPTFVEPSHSTHRSIETLVVVLAAITIIGVIAGIIARLCGGRHFGGDNDIEGWVERKCKSCIDGGIPPPAAPPPPPPPQETKPPTEETKK